MTTTGRIIRPASAQHAERLIDEAIRRRLPVNVAFWEVRKDEETGRPVRVPDPVTGKMTDTYVRTLRTIEFFIKDVSEAGNVVFTGVDRCPRNRAVPGAPWGAPNIRRVRVDRVAELSFVHSTYITPNPYFMEQVRKHAAERADHRGWRIVGDLADAELWQLIEYATDPNEAIGYARALAE